MFSQIQYLGVTIKSNLNRNLHTDNIATKLMTVCCLVFRLKNLIDQVIDSLYIMDASKG